MISLRNDVLYAFRGLLRRRTFALAALATLGLGIGANTAVFSALRAVFLRPLPYPEPERLVHIWASWPGGSGNFSFPDYVAMTERAHSFEALGAYEPWGTLTLASGDAALVLDPCFVTPSYLELLGAGAAAGRLFVAADDLAPGAPVALVSHELWQQHFGGDPTAVGRQVRLNGVAFTIVGVLERGFRDVGLVDGRSPDVWLPTSAAAALLGQPPLTDVYRIYWAVARLRPGVSLAQAREDLTRVARWMERERPATHQGYRLEARPLRQYVRGAWARPTLLLGAGSFCILLIGCANVGGLLLARLSERRREVALRAAIGASRGRLLRQLAVECLVLAVLGGGLGVAGAALLTPLLAAFVRSRVSPFLEVGVDAAALGVSILLCGLAALLFGLAPIWQATRVDLRDALGSGARDSAGAPAGRLRRGLVAAEVAFALVLLVGAGLMLRSFHKLTQTPLGFDTSRLLTFRMDLAGPRYAEEAARLRFADAFLEKASAVPGVASTTLWGPSMLGRATWVLSVLPSERPAARREDFVMTFVHATSPGALGNLGIPLLRGREFERADSGAAPPVAIVSQTVAEEFWPGEDPIGRQLVRPNRELPPITVVGVAADVRHRQRYDLADIAEVGLIGGLGPQRDVYLPYAQRARNSLTVAARLDGPVPPAIAALRAALASVDREVALSDVRLLEDRLDDQELAPVALAGLLAAYAALALFLAGLGVYGVVAQWVLQRTREIGLRIALGAAARDVVALVLRQGLRPVLAGLAAGLLGALGLARLMQSLLFDLAPADPVTFAGVGALLLLVAAAAAWLPARRATRVDPMSALRCE